MRCTLALVVAFAGLSALVAAPALSGSPAAATADGEGQKMVCKHQKSSTSRVPKKTCRARAEWDAIEEGAKKAAAQMMNRPVIETRRE